MQTDSNLVDLQRLSDILSRLSWLASRTLTTDVRQTFEELRSEAQIIYGRCKHLLMQVGFKGPQGYQDSYQYVLVTPSDRLIGMVSMLDSWKSHIEAAQ